MYDSEPFLPTSHPLLDEKEQDNDQKHIAKETKKIFGPESEIVHHLSSQPPELNSADCVFDME